MAEKLSPLVMPALPGLVGPGAVDTQRDTPGTADRKLTRNLKRRYDEIHNVPKVYDILQKRPSISGTLVSMIEHGFSV